MVNISEWWSKVTAQWAENRQRKLHNNLLRDSNEVIQLMEFEGIVHLSYNGVPIVRADNLSTDAVKVVKQSRQVWIDFKLREMKLDDNNLNLLTNKD